MSKKPIKAKKELTPEQKVRMFLEDHSNTRPEDYFSKLNSQMFSYRVGYLITTYCALNHDIEECNKVHVEYQFNPDINQLTTKLTLDVDNDNQVDDTIYLREKLDERIVQVEMVVDGIASKFTIDYTEAGTATQRLRDASSSIVDILTKVITGEYNVTVANGLSSIIVTKDKYELVYH